MANIYDEINQQDFAQGALLGKMDPWQTAIATGYAGGAQAARGVGGLFGMEDPRIAERREMEAKLNEVDFRNPETLFNIGKMLISKGEYEKGTRLLELADTIQYHTASAASSGGATKLTDVPETFRKGFIEKWIKTQEDAGIKVDKQSARELRGEYADAITSDMYRAWNMYRFGGGTVMGPEVSPAQQAKSAGQSLMERAASEMQAAKQKTEEPIGGA